MKFALQGREYKLWPQIMCEQHIDKVGYLQGIVGKMRFYPPKSAFLCDHVSRGLVLSLQELA